MTDEKVAIDVQILKYIKLLRRKWLMWVIPTVLFSAGAITYASILPDKYKSTCVLMVEESKVLDNLLLKSKGGVRSARGLLQAVKERMLGWRSVIPLIKILELDKDFSENDVGAMEKRYNEIIADTTVRTKGGSMIQVSYQGENPEINFRIVDGLVSNFMEFSLKDSRTEADETVEFIETDLKRLKGDLLSSERQLQGFEEEHFGELPGSENSMQARLFNAKNELTKVENEISIMTEKIGFLDESIDKEDQTITGEVTRVPNPMVNTLKDQINKLKIDVNALRAKYFDEHPSIASKLKELESLKIMLDQEDESIVSEEKIVNNPMYDGLMEQGFSAQLQIKTLHRQKKEIKKTIDNLNASIKGMPALRQEMNELVRGYDVNKTLYEQRLKEKAKADLMKEMSLDAKTNPFNIIEPARISYEPVKAVKIKIVGMGIVMGLGLGVGLIIGLEKIDPRFKTIEEVQEYLSIPVLGMIPTITTYTEIKRDFRKKIIVSSSFAVFVIITVAVCLIVEPVKSIVSDKATAGWGKIVEMAKN